MYNPPHVGALIADHLDGLKEQGQAVSLAKLADHIGITRTTLSRIVNGRQALSADIAVRLNEALGIRADLLLKMQAARDLWTSQSKPRPHITPLYAASSV